MPTNSGAPLPSVAKTIASDQHSTAAGRSYCPDELPYRTSISLHTVIAPLCFWALCLTLSAAGHWVYVATRSLDRVVSADIYRTPGRAIVWVGHGSLAQAQQHVLGSDTASSGPSLPTVLPVSPFWLASAAAFTVFAALLAWSGRWIFDNGIQSLVGLFAGHALWLGAIEIGLDNAGRRLGLAGSLDTVNGTVVGVHSAGILIQLSLVFLIPVLIGLTLHESNRCVVFKWFRLRLPLTRHSSATGLVDNYAARTTIQFFMTVWVCYVGVLWIADPTFASIGQPLLLAVFVVIVGATPYMMWRTARQASRGQMLRYSVSGAVVTWTGIEIAAAMRLFSEPWLNDSLLSGAVLVGISIVLTLLTYYFLIRPDTHASTVGASDLS